VGTAAALALSGLTALAPAARAADTDLARNGGFEAGLDGWTCTAGAAVHTPVRSGTSALQATPAGSDNAQCTQTVTVKPDSQYTLTGYVRGSYVYLGASGTGTTEVSTWTQSAVDWQQLTTTFRTGASTGEVTIYTHGWYGTGAYYAEDISLIGPGAAAGQPPAAPTGLKTGTVTSSSAALSWSAVAGATSYAVYRDGVQVQTVSGTSATVTGLSPSTAYTQVTAVNDAGESAKSAAVTATTPTGSGGSTDLPAHTLVGYLHASFANGSGYTRLADVPAGTSSTSPSANPPPPPPATFASPAARSRSARTWRATPISRRPSRPSRRRARRC
jgi:hypothetical protein